ncbi:hypothetical protein C8Q76DRAFT_769423 [Earliella scabrosa]|nr:hypothetical protein C8Q76DRAFT_769423 [Earliella scabrosa]
MSLIVHPRTCLYCGFLAYMWCSRCHSAWYCSQMHMNMDWTQHRLWCIPHNMCHPTEGTVAMVPDRHEWVTGYVFWPTEENPIITRIHYIPGFTTSNQSAQPEPQLQSIVTDSIPTEALIEGGISGSLLRFPLSIWYCTTSFQRGGPLNRAVERLVGQCVHRAWYGPVVLLKYGGSRRRQFAGVHGYDLPVLAAYFRSLV